MLSLGNGLRKTDGHCPDRRMLSVYLDGELPSPWREKLEGHVSGCTDCAGRIETYRIASAGATADDEAVSEAGERVWRRLDASVRQARFPRRPAIWRRSVALPLPAAAAILVFALALAWVFAGPGAQETQAINIAGEAGLEVPVQGIESVAEYLIGRGGSETVILRLPDNRSFVSGGEPAMIRAADYSRQIASWQGRRRN